MTCKKCAVAAEKNDGDASCYQVLTLRASPPAHPEAIAGWVGYIRGIMLREVLVRLVGASW
eukprot:1363463-Pyramimonas_sp.AAC.1